MRNDLLESVVIVGEIGGQIATERLQVVFSEGCLVLDCGADWEHAGKAAGDAPEPSHGTLGDSSADDEGVLSRVLV